MKGRGFRVQYTKTQWTGNTSLLTGTNTPKSLPWISIPRQSIQWSQKGLAGDALKQFITDFGVPDKIICDGSKEQTKRGTTFMGQVRKHHIDIHTTEPGWYNQSKVEGVICELRKNWFRTMHRKRVPKRLWDYGLKWVSEARVRTSSDATDLKGRTPLERVTGDTVDISEYLAFGFYDWCWYHKKCRVGTNKVGQMARGGTQSWRPNVLLGVHN